MIPVLLFIVQEIWHNNPIQLFLVEMNGWERYELKAKTILTSFISMTITMPFMLRLSSDIMNIFQTYFAIWDINLVPANLHFNNLLAIKSLGNVDSVILNKRAIIDSRKRRVHAFRVNGQCFYNDIEVPDPETSKNIDRPTASEEQSSDSSDSEQIEIKYLPTD